MRGNACYNFIGNMDAIKNWIDATQLNSSFEKALVLAIDNDNEKVVYPELNQHNHAVIDRILKKEVA